MKVINGEYADSYVRKGNKICQDFANEGFAGEEVSQLNGGDQNMRRSSPISLTKKKKRQRSPAKEKTLPSIKWKHHGEEAVLLDIIDGSMKHSDQLSI